MNFDLEKHKKIIILLSYLVLTLTGAYFVFVKAIPIVTPFIIALIFAFLINPIVDFFNEKLKINRKVSSLMVILLIFAILISLLAIAITEIYSLSESLIAELLSTANLEGLNIISKEINRVFGIDIDLTNTVKNLVLPLAQGLLSVIKSIASNIPQAFIASVVFILSTYIIIVDKQVIISFMEKIIGKQNVNWISEIRRISKKSITQYVKAQLILMSVTFSELLVGFTIMELIGIFDLQYIFLIAFLVALLDALPIFGTGTVLIPWCLYNVIIARFDGAIALLIMYIICLVVRQFIEPKVVGESLGLHPLVTLLSMYIGLQLLGLGGMILLPIITLFVIQLYKAGAFDKIKKMLD